MCHLNSSSFLCKESFANVAFWLDALQHHGDMIKTVLVANKSDLESVVDDSVEYICIHKNLFTLLNVVQMYGSVIMYITTMISDLLIFDTSDIERHG